jgi:cob(I)alamin adenosyltransferase
MVIFDEINDAIAYGLISVDSVVELMQQRPRQVHVVLTGRDADPRILKLAELAKEMVEMKHPYRKRKIARKGIEY